MMPELNRRGAAVSKATLGKVRRMLVARLAPEVLNPFARTPEHNALLRDTLAEICADPELDLAASPALLAAIEGAICGLGPLQPLVDDPEVADILVNAPDSIFIERGGRLEPTAIRLDGPRALVELAERIAALAGRELSVAHPVVDARMPDGSRVNAVIPPVGGPYLSIRKFNRLRLDLVPGGRHGRSWVEADGMSAELADFLIGMVRARANFLVAGETGAGKTTLLRSLTDGFAPDERVGVVEDTAELAVENANRFNLETLHPTDLASGEADARLLDVGDLVANALRMRPDRLIVGEIRLPKEAFYTLQALHTGHDGSATTIHASSAEDALFRLELLARQSMRDLSAADLRTYIARVFDLVVVLRRLNSGRRIVHQVAALDGLASDAAYRLNDVFRAEPYSGQLRWSRDPEWRPPERLRARLELEGDRWS
jgi:pilus assembly protein CpaF